MEKEDKIKNNIEQNENSIITGLEFLVIIALVILFGTVLSIYPWIINNILHPVNSLHTLYVNSSLYPKSLFVPSLTFYGLNQSNGTACIIKAEEVFYSFNYTTQSDEISKIIQITNRTTLIDLAEQYAFALPLLPNNSYTLVCPQNDFNTEVS